MSSDTIDASPAVPGASEVTEQPPGATEEAVVRIRQDFEQAIATKSYDKLPAYIDALKEMETNTPIDLDMLEKTKLQETVLDVLRMHPLVFDRQIFARLSSVQSMWLRRQVNADMIKWGVKKASTQGGLSKV